MRCDGAGEVALGRTFGTMVYLSGNTDVFCSLNSALPMLFCEQASTWHASRHLVSGHHRTRARGTRPYLEHVANVQQPALGREL